MKQFKNKQVYAHILCIYTSHTLTYNLSSKVNIQELFPTKVQWYVFLFSRIQFNSEKGDRRKYLLMPSFVALVCKLHFSYLFDIVDSLFLPKSYRDTLFILMLTSDRFWQPLSKKLGKKKKFSLDAFIILSLSLHLARKGKQERCYLRK